MKIFSNLKNYSYGASSAVITGLAIIIGLSSTTNAVMNMIAAILIIAIADNVADSFGLHIHQEAENISPRDVRITTALNFISRILVLAVFIMFLIILPMMLAIILCIITGLLTIILLSYYIAKLQKISPQKEIFRHVLLAAIVMLVSFGLRELITRFAVAIIK